MVEHVVQSKSEKKNKKKKKNIFLYVWGAGGGGGGGAAPPLMARSRPRGHNFAKLGPTEKKYVFAYFLY